jgi:hypothetical protein
MYGVFKTLFFNTFFTSPTVSPTFSFEVGMIFYSETSISGYTLDNTGIVIENSLTNFNPNSLISTMPFIHSSMTLYNYGIVKLPATISI